MTNCPNRDCTRGHDQYDIPKCAHCIRCGQLVQGVHVCVDRRFLKNANEIP